MSIGFDVAIALEAQDCNTSIESIRNNHVDPTVFQRFEEKTKADFKKKEAYLKRMQARVMEVYIAQKEERQNGDQEEEEAVGAESNDDGGAVEGDVGGTSEHGPAA
jgi:hypothetical protein